MDPAPTSRTSAPPSSGKRVLDPMDRIAEVLFGLIMVLTFTGSLSAATSGHEEIRTMLIGAIGCNLAWGIVDGAMYLMAQLSERGRGLTAYRIARHAGEPERARAAIAEALPPVVASVMSAAELDAIRERLRAQPEPPPTPRLQGSDWLGAVGVLLLVFLSTFPVVLPFLLMHDARTALRVSNGIALVLLFLTGHALGRVAGHRPLRTGLWMVLIGVVLVALTIALGG
jgi:hypothetical protein